MRKGAKLWPTQKKAANKGETPAKAKTGTTEVESEVQEATEPTEAVQPELDLKGEAPAVVPSDDLTPEDKEQEAEELAFDGYEAVDTWYQDVVEDSTSRSAQISHIYVPTPTGTEANLSGKVIPIPIVAAAVLYNHVEAWAWCKRQHKITLQSPVKIKFDGKTDQDVPLAYFVTGEELAQELKLTKALPDNLMGFSSINAIDILDDDLRDFVPFASSIKNNEQVQRYRSNYPDEWNEMNPLDRLMLITYLRIRTNRIK